MGCTRPPGVLDGSDPWAPARTPGPLGVNDQADPSRCTALGDTPGPTGVRDGGDPTLPNFDFDTLVLQGQIFRVGDRAFSLALDGAVDGLQRAPWMATAEAEARQFKGETEEKIQKVINFQKEVGIKEGTMVGDDGEWCAAFVNYCLKQGGIATENTGFYDATYAKVRANAFHRVTQFKPDKSKKESPMVPNPLYVEIDHPVFGAIGMVAHSDGYGHHVGFVYSQPDANTIVLLGGNQSDRIKFSSKNLKATAATTTMVKGKKVTKAAQKDHLVFYVPASYEAFAKRDTQALSNKTANALNDDFGIVAPKEAGGPESTR